MRCHSRIRTDTQGMALSAAAPTGLGPPDLVAAYGLPSSGAHGKTVAIVDAYDNPNAEADLAVYRAQYGLPPCTTANGCFRKVNQLGQPGPYPIPDQGWSGEISLDVDMVSAVCPDCKILLVEANEPSTDALGAAVNMAVQLGASAVSNSYGGPEDASIVDADELYFHHPGVTITVSAGDTGTGAAYPATGKYVTAVGGTTLARSTQNSRGWVESAWGKGFFSKYLGGTGSGCSKFISKPSFETDTKCANRMESDVSAVADPATGPAVYDTYGYGGWLTVGGTSASAPIIAGIYTLTGHAGAEANFSYTNPGAFFDVTSGSNGWFCHASYFCNGKVGYDGPTGNGTPNGPALLALP